MRLLLAEDGGVEIAAVPLGLPASRPLRFALSPHRTRSGDLFLRHKTTRRALYDGEYARVRGEGLDEAVFLNERGELTEGSRTTLFLRFDGVLATPPLSAGVLDGTLRRHLLDHGAAPHAVRVEERALIPADLARADAIYLGNSVRGLEQAMVAEPIVPHAERASG